MKLPGFLCDCQTKDASLCELLILKVGPHYEEARSLRDRIVQAVLGVDPNIVNPMTADIGEVLDDESFKAIIAAVGTGIQLGLGEPPLFDLAPCRYGRIILAFENTFNDPKARENLIHFFHLYMPPLINEGRVFLVDSENIPQKDFVAQVLDPVSRKLIKVEPDTSGIYIARKQDMFGSE